MKKPLTAAVLAAICLLTGWWVCRSYAAITAVSPVILQEGEKELPTIVIDAGHGGFDGGAVGVDGIVEKDINLSIALKLYDLFTVNGFDAVLTRDSDISLHRQEDTTLRKKKNSDLHNRLAIASSYENAILLSIHQNKFTHSRFNGAQIFYGPKNEKSEPFAEIMQRRFIEMLQPENTRKYKKTGDSVFLIYNAPMPALLVECGFLSNPEEAYQLIDAEYQQKVAFTIFAGTMEYLGLEYEAPLETSSESEEAQRIE